MDDKCSVVCHRRREIVKQKGRIPNKGYQELNDISREMATIDLKKLVKMKILIPSGGQRSRCVLRFEIIA